MDFELNEDQRMLRESAGRMIADRYTFEARKGFIASEQGWSRDIWQQFAELGLLGLPFAEADGGVGGGVVETMLVMEAIGGALTLEPYMATVVLAGGLLRRMASARQKAELIPAIADGRLVLAFAQAEKQSRFDLFDVATSARQEGDGWVLNGEKRHVLHGDSAGKLLVSARVSGGQRDRDGIALFLVDADAGDVSVRGYQTQDRQRAAQVILDGVRIGAENIVGEPGKALASIEQVADEAIAALCAEAVGVMETSFDTTIDYLKVREQFGTPIGSFQVLQHRAVDMLIKLEEARSMAMYATMMSTEPDAAARSRAISMAKLKVCEAGKFVCEQAIQLHGGIGMTDEHKVGHHYRRMTMIEVMFGDRAHHLERLGGPG